jgi:hypothetical protein
VNPKALLLPAVVVMRTSMVLIALEVLPRARSYLREKSTRMVEDPEDEAVDASAHPQISAQSHGRSTAGGGSSPG